MLDSLHIENMAVFERLDADFEAGLTAITGETGSGKSVMIDSILFLLGGKPARDMVRSGTERGLVSAVFSNVGEECLSYLSQIGFETEPDEQLLLQRTLTADGKSQARLSGRVIPQNMLRELSKFLVSVHGQNDNQLLLQRSAQEKILDNIADLGSDLSAYRQLFAERTSILEDLSELNRDTAEKNRLRDILQFQIGEIDGAHLKEGEEEDLCARRVKLQNAEKITHQASFAYRALYGSEKGSAALLLERAAQALSGIATVLPESADLAKKLTEMRYEVEEIANIVRDYAEENDGDPTEALNRVEARLDLITKLERKYGVDIPSILAFGKNAKEKLAILSDADGEAERLHARLSAVEQEMRRLTAVLHTKRVQAAKSLSALVCEQLHFLDMPGVRFEIMIEAEEGFLPTGSDHTVFSIATNPGEPMLPLSRIASGGELSRVMLALKSVLNDRDGVSTAVFDEVDTGISGKTARKIGIKLAEIGKRTQVICVTHSAQIASLATTHFKITKETLDGRAVASLTPLDESGRINEVARILGGLSVTDAQRTAASEMIEEGKRYR